MFQNLVRPRRVVRRHGRAADFLGGLASRRASTIAIVVISQLAGLIALVLMLPLLPEWGRLATI